VNTTTRCLLIMIACCLVGCGFQLRSSELARLPEEISDIEIQSNIPSSLLTNQLTQDLHVLSTHRKSDHHASPYILHILNQNFEKRQLTVSASTQVRQYLLLDHIEFRIEDIDKRAVTETMHVSAARYYTQNQSAILGSNNEEIQLHSEMIKELSHRIIEKLGHVTILFHETKS